MTRTAAVCRLALWVGLVCCEPAHGVAWAQAPALRAATVAAIDRAVAAEMEKQAVVGVAVGVIRQGQIVYLQGYGLADRERGTPVTTESVFNWASNSKPLAAVLAMQLVDRGRLDLDADVRRYVPEFPDKGATIRVRHLLCHQSGIPHYSNGTVLATERKYSSPKPFADPVLALDCFNRSPLLFEPGTRTDYSSYAYILLSAVIARAGDEPFERQLQRRIATPLGLSSLVSDAETNGQPHWVAGYVKDRAGRVVAAAEEAHDWKHGAGGYKSNVRDFARWAQALIDGELVSPAAQAAMWTRQTTAGGDETTWGLGFVVESQAGLKISHNGRQNETTTRLVIYPQSRHGVVVLCNGAYAATAEFSTAIYSALRTQ